MLRLPFTQAFAVLQDRENHFRQINQEDYPPNFVLAQLALISIFIFCYGIIMGSYNSLPQAMITGAKLWVLLFLTLLICFPSFYIVQLILGSKIKMKQLALILLSGFVMTTTIMLAFAPIVLFFQLSGDNYHFLQLLHVFVFVFSGFFGMRVVLEALKSAFESDGVYPRIGLTVFRIWVIIFAFVSIQLSWNLRPFLGSKDMPFELFRQDTRGNFYSTVLGAFGKMLGVDQIKENMEKAKSQTPKPPTVPEEETPISVPPKDSLE